VSERKLNPRILDKVRENSEGDDAIRDFLVDLIYEEAENSFGWHWRETYNQKVGEYSKKWRKESED
jgi:hypothetical protein